MGMKSKDDEIHRPILVAISIYNGNILHPTFPSPSPSHAYGGVAYSGSVDGRIDEAALRRTRLVLGWVTVSRRVHYVGM